MASRVVTRRYDRALAPAGVTANGFSILARLEHEGPLPLGALAARLAIDRSSLSRELAPLVASGLVESSDDPTDRRRRLLALSDLGSARVAEARPLWQSAQEEIDARFGAARSEKLRDELHALVRAGR
jgi:DNA-binding MarR family transcriptional regulator